MSSKHYSTNIPNKKQRNKEMKNTFEKKAKSQIPKGKLLISILRKTPLQVRNMVYTRRN